MELSTSERKLLSRAIHREPEAFSELYLQYRQSVLRHVYYLVGNLEEADDITSETFLRAWKAIERFEDRGISIQAWLLKIAYNLGNQHLRRRRPTVTVKDIDDVLFDDNAPEVAAERSMEMRALGRALLSLPAIQRKVVVLRFLNELRYEEIEAIVGKSNGALRVIQHRAFQALRQSLAESQLSSAVMEERLLAEASSEPAGKTTLRVAQQPARS